MNFPRVSALALAAVLGASLAQAQTTPPPPPAPGAPMAAAHQWDPAKMRERREAREAEHIKALHDVLAIRPDQEAAFQSFVAGMHPRHDGAPGERRQPGMGWNKDGAGAQPPMTAPERLDAQLKRFDERTAHMRQALEAHAATVKSFYAVLSPEQKRTLDALPMLMGGHRDHDGFRGHDGRGPHGGPGMTGETGPMAPDGMPDDGR
jgi:hypothetical protein